MRRNSVFTGEFGRSTFGEKSSTIYDLKDDLPGKNNRVCCVCYRKFIRKYRPNMNKWEYKSTGEYENAKKHYNDAIMSAMASQITSPTDVYSTVYSGTDERKHQSSASMTFVTHVPWCMPGSLSSSFLWSRWRGKRFRHSRRMRNPQFYVSGKRPIEINILDIEVDLTNRGRSKMADIFETVYSNAFSQMKISWLWFKLHWRLLLSWIWIGTGRGVASNRRDTWSHERVLTEIYGATCRQ